MPDRVFHRAGRDDHAAGPEGTAGDGRGQVLVTVHFVGQRLYILERPVGFERDVQLATVADDEMDLRVRHLAQRFQEAYAVDGAAGAGNGDDEPHGNSRRFRSVA